MRLLVDANLSPRVAVALREAHIEVAHVADLGLLTATDDEIARFAEHEGFVIVTSDSDFGTILARSGRPRPSVVLLRHLHDVAPDRQVTLICAAVETAADQLDSGAIVTLGRGRLRARSLPIE